MSNLNKDFIDHLAIDASILGANQIVFYINEDSWSRVYIELEEFVHSNFYLHEIKIDAFIITTAGVDIIFCKKYKIN